MLKKVIFFTSFLILSLLMTQSVLAEDSAHWASGSINNFISKGILAADEISAEEYDTPITRGKFVSILMRTAQTKGEIDPQTQYFTDIGLGDELYSDTARAKVSGYVMGYENGDFCKDNLITRQELFAIVCRVFDIQDQPGTQSFSDDSEILDYAKPAFQKLIGNEIIKGYDDGTVKPFSNITCAEAVAILERSLTCAEAQKQAALKPTATPVPTPVPTPYFSSTTGSTSSGSSSKSSSNSDSEPTKLPVISCSKSTENKTDKPVKITVAYTAGTDRIVKKSWVRVNTLPNNQTLKQTYVQNKQSEVSFEGSSKTYEVDAKINGVYIFCAWTADTEAPTVAEYVTVNNLEDTECPEISLTISETADTYNPIIVDVSATDNMGIKEIRWMKSRYESMELLDVHTVETARLPQGIEFDEIYDAYHKFPYRESDDFVSLSQKCGSAYAVCIVYSYYYNLSDVEGVVKNTEHLLENNRLEIKQNGIYYICVEDLSGNKAFKRVEVENIKLAKATFTATLNDDFKGDYVGYVQVASIIPNPNAAVTREFFMMNINDLRAGYAVARDSNFIIEDRINNLFTSFIIPKTDGKYYIRDFGEYRLYMLDEWGNYSYTTFEVYPEEGDDLTPPEISYTLSPPEGWSESVTVTLDITDDTEVAKVRWLKSDQYVTDYEFFLWHKFCWMQNEQKTLEGNTIEITENGDYIVCAMDTSGNTSFMRIRIETIEPDYIIN